MITRPAHQAGALSQTICSAGGETFLFPTLAIIPATLTAENKAQLQNIKQYDFIIFISPNAVKYGLEHIHANITLPNDLLLATIGQGSAKILMDSLGKPADVTPKENFNSDGLLATQAMQDVANKHILIIRGNGGREHLKETLEKRGAIVDYLTAYQRIRPASDSPDLEQYLQNNRIAAIVITSATSLKNLQEMTPESVMSKLLNVPLLLINKRLITIAKEAGFTNDLLVAREASDESILQSLKENNFL